MIFDDLLLLLVTKENDSNEYQIAKYIIEHSKDILNLSFNQMIEGIHVSKSTLTRFFRSIGVHTFNDFQQEFYGSLKDFPKTFDFNVDNSFFNTAIKNVSGKKRIVVYGEPIFLGELLYYKKVFLNKNIELYFKLIPSKWEDFVEECHLTKDDFFIHLTPNYTKFKLYFGNFHSYSRMERYFQQRNISYVHMSLEGNDENNTSENTILVKDNNYLEQTKMIGKLFETIYSII